MNIIQIVTMANANVTQIIFISWTLIVMATGHHNHVNCANGDASRCSNRFHASYVDKRSGTEGRLDQSAADADIDSLQNLRERLDVDDDRIGDLLDLNSEPAVEDLTRQIMSQAKLWEAIQEANREIVTQKDERDSKTKERFPMAFSAQ